MKYTDPTGMWIDNEDGTYTAEEGDTLYGLYGDDWQSKSGYTGDPTKLQIGDIVGNNNSPAKDDSQPTENKESTLSSWWSKKAGEELTDEEKNLQKGIGIGEMIAGPTLGTLGCAQTGGQSVLYGYYLMADGAVMVSKAEEGVKAIPGAFFLNLLCPVAGTVNGVPIVVEYNTSPLPAVRYR